MFRSHTEACAIMFSQEFRSNLSAQVERMIADVESQVAGGERRFDQIEEDLRRQLFEVGRNVLQEAVDAAAREEDQKAPQVIEREDAPTLQLVTRKPRRLVTIFGEIRVSGPAYAMRAKQAVEFAAVDRRLSLPEGDFSYLFESWAQRFCVKDAFGDARTSLHELLGIGVSIRSLEAMNQRLAQHVEDFRMQQPAPEAFEEGDILVVLSDATGVPMRQRAGGAKMAYLGASYTIDRFVRSVDQILDEALRQQVAKGRPRPQFKRLYGDLSRALPEAPEQELDGRIGVFTWLQHEITTRNSDGKKPVICLMDGESRLWTCKQYLLPSSVVEILDLWHVMQRLREIAGHLHGAQTEAAEKFTETRLRSLLEGKVGRVIGGLKQIRTKLKPTGSLDESLSSAITYFENNRARMRYDEYLKEGYPIASGVIEGACRHVVGDRLDRTGMRWCEAGALSMLQTRTTYLSDDWQTYQEFRIQLEQEALQLKAHTC